MRDEKEVREELAKCERDLTNAVEFQETKRLNNGFDEDFEGVMERIILVGMEQVRLLKWILQETKAIING